MLDNDLSSKSSSTVITGMLNYIDTVDWDQPSQPELTDKSKLSCCTEQLVIFYIRP